MTKLERGRPSVVLSVIGALLVVASASGDEIRLVSKAGPRPPSATADRGSDLTTRQSVSADGRFVAFFSRGTNLVPGQVDYNAGEDVFLGDLVAGTTALVSHAASDPLRAAKDRSDPSAEVLISADGRFVAYTSFGTDLVPGQGSSRIQNLYLYDRLSQQNVLVSHVEGNPTLGRESESRAMGLSADGRLLLFLSDPIGLIPGPVSFFKQLFLYDRVTGVRTLVSHVAGAPQAPCGQGVQDGRLSGNGERVAFLSESPDLVSPATTDSQVFLYERASGLNRLISHDASNPALGASASGTYGPVLSEDGAYVAFVSPATNLVAGFQGPTDGLQVYLAAAASGSLSLVSRAASPTKGGNGHSGQASVSADGRFVAFQSAATDLTSIGPPRATAGDIYVFDRLSGAVSLVSHAFSTSAAADAPSSSPQLSSDGLRVAFQSGAQNLAAGQGPSTYLHLFVHDRTSGTTRLADAALGLPTSPANGYQRKPSASAGGDVLAFAADATDLSAGPDDNADLDVFAWSWTRGTVSIVSAPEGPAVTGANGGSRTLFPLPGDPTNIGPSITPDGRYLLFTSEATDLAPVPPRSYGSNLFLYDRLAGTTEAVSGTGAASGATSFWGGLSDDGRYVVFGGPGQVFLYDRITKSRSPRCNGACERWGISGDGRFIVLDEITSTYPTNRNNVLLQDRATGGETIVSRSAASPTLRSNGSSSTASISRDGRFVLFFSSSTDLVAGQSGNGGLYLFDRTDGSVAIVAHPEGQPLQVAPVSIGRMTPDARYIAFISSRADLLPGQVADPAGYAYVYLYDRVSAEVTLISHRAGRPLEGSGVDADVEAGLLGLTADGRFVAFASTSSDLVAGQQGSPGQINLFLHDRVADVTVLVNRVAGSVATAAAGGFWAFIGLGGDGRFLAYASKAQNLVPGQIDTPDSIDIFVFDATTGLNKLISRSLTAAATTANDRSWQGVQSEDGNYLAFEGWANDLVTADFNGVADVFINSTVLSPPAGSFALHTVSPCRLVDTRDAVGPAGGPPLAAGGERSFPVADRCGIPATAKVVVLNVTVTGATAGGNLRVYAGGAAPLASTINYARGQTRANAAIVAVGPGGAISVRSDQPAGSVHVILDVSGYLE